MSRRDFLFPGEPDNVLIALRPLNDDYSSVSPIDDEDRIDARISRILTQYRESPHLIALIKAYLEEIEGAYVSIRTLPAFFNIDLAVQDQLTIIGKWIGWPRRHACGIKGAVFGFDKDCDVCYDGPPLAGFCRGSWDGCGDQFSEYVFTDDDLYRRFLLSRIVQRYGDFRRSTLETAARFLFDEEKAYISQERAGRVVLSLGRPFQAEERAILHLYRQVLPVAPGVQLLIRAQNVFDVQFGFGEGWGGFCSGVFV